MKTYHFCVSHVGGAQTHWRHGLVKYSADLAVGAVEYFKLVDVIGAEMTPPRAGRDLIVHSLTVIDGGANSADHDWDFEFTRLAGRIMNDLGHAHEPSQEPGVDLMRDKIAQRIQASFDEVLANKAR